MTREDIIKLAQEAGGLIWGDYCFEIENLERFAALVAAAERERCAKVCNDAAASYGESGWVQAASNCAAAIRELK